jgi:hypothetical protein
VVQGKAVAVHTPAVVAVALVELDLRLLLQPMELVELDFRIQSQEQLNTMQEEVVELVLQPVQQSELEVLVVVALVSAVIIQRHQ